MPFAKPDTKFPITLPDGSHHSGTVFLKAVLTHPRIEVGDYSYYSDHAPLGDPSEYAGRIAPYLFDFSPERLVIGKFCQIASGAQFITSSANHRYDGISTFPFAIFDGMGEGRPSMPTSFRDTIIGNDVWIGTGAMILPGARIGSGVIVGAGAVVRGTVPDYAIVSGNPASVVRHRFDPQQVARLMEIAWWDWPIELIVANEAAICGGDIDTLERVVAKG